LVELNHLTVPVAMVCILFGDLRSALQRPASTVRSGPHRVYIAPYRLPLGARRIVSSGQ
jgi:hypothetical protein